MRRAKKTLSAKKAVVRAKASKARPKAAKMPVKKRAKRRSLERDMALLLRREIMDALAIAEASVKAPGARGARDATVSGLAVEVLGSNQQLLDQILGGHYPADTKLDPPFDGLARAGLAARIRRAGVIVDRAVVIACTTVGCVLAEMNRVRPGDR